jgi:hypothetical protein
MHGDPNAKEDAWGSQLKEKETVKEREVWT